MSDDLARTYTFSLFYCERDFTEYNFYQSPWSNYLDTYYFFFKWAIHTITHLYLIYFLFLWLISWLDSGRFHHILNKWCEITFLLVHSTSLAYKIFSLITLHKFIALIYFIMTYLFCRNLFQKINVWWFVWWLRYVIPGRPYVSRSSVPFTKSFRELFGPAHL